MSRLLPHTPEVRVTPRREHRLRYEDAGAVLDALQSDTARRLLASLHRQPGTPSDLADRLGTSIQTVAYHLQNLQDADLIEIVDRWYSPKGREMDVYAPVADRLVIDVCLGIDDDDEHPLPREP